MDWVGLVKALLGVAQPLLDKLWLSQVTQYLTEYEDNEKALLDEQGLYPDWDASKIETLTANRKRLADAMEKQVALVKPPQAASPS